MYSTDSHCQWNYHSYLKSPIAGSINFGVSVDIDGENVVVGASSYGMFHSFPFNIC